MTLRPDNTHFLVAAQERRHQELIKRATLAIRALDRGGKPITFATVVRASGVSRSFLNKVPELADEIRRLREVQPVGTRRLPSTQRMSGDSMDARLMQITETNRKLREEVAWLREQNAVLLGKLRQA